MRPVLEAEEDHSDGGVGLVSWDMPVISELTWGRPLVVAEGSRFKSSHVMCFKDTLNFREIGVAVILWEGTKPDKFFLLFY